MSFKKAVVFFTGSVIMTFVYIILSEAYSLKSLGIGVLFGISSMLVCVLFFSKNFLERYEMKIPQLLWYFIRLIIIIVISGIKSLLISFFEDTTTLLIEYKSSLKSDMLITLLANSITLTPGTTTIDKNDNALKVMRLCKKGNEENVDDIKKLEELIAKAERSGA